MSLIKLFLTKGNVLLKISMAIFVFAFIGAFYNHANDLIRGGLFPYEKLNHNVPTWLNIYWTMLTFLDLLAIIVLFLDMKKGQLLYLAIIVSDVIINFSFVIHHYGQWSWVNFMQICQLLFMIFVVATFFPIKKAIGKIENIERKQGKVFR